jgi:UrcA family protein
MKTIILAAGAAASLSAAPAFAQNNAPTRIEISAAGLDLATAEGRAALDLRVLHAARTACGTPSPADALGQTRLAACVADVRLAAAAQRDTLVAAAQPQQQQAGRTLAGR